MISSAPSHDVPRAAPQREYAPNPPEPAPPLGELVDWRELGALLRRGYRFVVGVGLLTFSVVMAVTLASRMEFRASGRLYLGEVDGKPRQGTKASDEIDLSGGGQSDVWSEVEIIRSRGLATQAILRSGLNVDIARYGSRKVRYFEWLWSRRDPRLLDDVARELVASNTQTASPLRSARSYRVHFVGDTEYELWLDGQRVGQGKLAEPLVASDLTLTLSKGAEAGPRRGGQYELTVRPLDEVRERALKSLDVSVPKAASAGEPVKVVTLTFNASSPRLSAAFLDTLMHGYLEERRSWKAEDATAAEMFITDQLGGMRTSLDQLEKRLTDYRTQHRTVVLDNEAKAMIEQIGKYEEQRVAARLEVAALGDIKKALKHPNPPLGAYLFGEADDTVLEQLATSLTKAREQLTDLEARFNAPAPEVRAQRAQVDAQLEVIRNYVSSRLARAQENQAALGGIIGQFEERLKTVPSAEIGLARLSRESEVYSRLYSYLLERRQQMAIVKASTVSENRVLDAPEPTYREDFPRLGLRLASLPLGLLLGTLLLILRRFLSDTFQSEDDVRKSVGTLPVLASVPFERRLAGERRNGSVQLDPFHAQPQQGFEEAFRMLRTSLYTVRPRELPKVVLVTSASPGDGKTLCTLALAALFAAERKSVLVVDANLREPTHRAGQAAPGELNLEAALKEECDWRAAVHRVGSAFGQFDSLGASAALSPELLSSEPMGRLLDEARGSYDCVLLDSPSFPLVADALALAVVADWVLTVVSLERTPRRLMTEHVRRLSLCGKPQAIVVNDARAAKRRSRRRPPPARPGLGAPSVRSTPLVILRRTPAATI